MIFAGNRQPRIASKKNAVEVPTLPLDSGQDDVEVGDCGFKDSYLGMMLGGVSSGRDWSS